MSAKKHELEVDGRTIGVSSPTKQLVEGVTKLDIATYWQLVGSMTIAAVGRRLISAKRVPDGAGGETFFQKNKPAGMPTWIRTARVPSNSSDQGHTDHIVLMDVSHLVALAQFGTVEVHVGTWDIDDPFRPRELLLDLDPPPGAATDDVRHALRCSLTLLDEIGLPWRVKATGSKGFHVHVPVDGPDQQLVSDVAGDIAHTLGRRHPDELTVEFHKEQRRGRVLVDVWRNSGGATAVAPWSPRIAPGGPVARPLTRDEVTDQLDDIVPDGLPLLEVADFLDQHGDPWAEELGAADLGRLESAADVLRDA